RRRGRQDDDADTGGRGDRQDARGRLVEAPCAEGARRPVGAAGPRLASERGADPRLGAGLQRGGGQVAQRGLAARTPAPTGELEAARRFPATRLARPARRLVAVAAAAGPRLIVVTAPGR